MSILTHFHKSIENNKLSHKQQSKIKKHFNLKCISKKTTSFKFIMILTKKSFTFFNLKFCCDKNFLTKKSST